MRYDKRQILENDRPEFQDMLKERARNYFLHYDTPQLRYPSVDEMAKLNTVTEVWKKGDRLYKYAHEYYGDPQLWWIVAWYNQRPTEGNLRLGDIVEIPLPLEQILKYLGV